MDSVGVQRDGTIGWKNYSWVQKVGRIILVYRRLEELFWCTEGWKNYSGVPKKKTGVPKVGRVVDICGQGTGSLCLEHSRAKPSLVACLPGTE